MVNKTSRTFNEVSRNYFSAPNQNRVRWNMVPSDPPCCVLIPPVSYILGFDEEILKSRKTWDSKMAEIIPNEKRSGACSLPGDKI